VRRRVGRDERAVDDEDEVELGRLGLARVRDVPADVDAGVAGRSGSRQLVWVCADAGEDGAELQLTFGEYA
jgi:hypothetical protein